MAQRHGKTKHMQKSSMAQRSVQSLDHRGLGVATYLVRSSRVCIRNVRGGRFWFVMCTHLWMCFRVIMCVC